MLTGKNMKQNNMVICHRGSLRKVHLAPPPCEDHSEMGTEEMSEISHSHSSVASPHHTIYTISISTHTGKIETDELTTSNIYDKHEKGYEYGKRACIHELCFDREHFDFISNLFAILDTKSRGYVDRECVKAFVSLRCPVFRRRDQFSEKIHQLDSDNADWSDSTFDEVWRAVILCCNFVPDDVDDALIGIEGWMVFCRFITLVQYEEAKRKFSARHSQETMQRKGSGEEVVLVNVSPPEPPIPITVQELMKYEEMIGSTTSGGAVSLPQLDLDHSYISVHDDRNEHRSKSVGEDSPSAKLGSVEISVFGSSLDSKSTQLTANNSSEELEFVIKFFPHEPSTNPSEDSCIVVRRTFADMEWLHNTFTLHKKVGGTLCGRILPPFPSRVSETKSDYNEESNSKKKSSSAAAIAVANAGVGMISSAAKSARSLWGSYTSSNTSDSPSKKKASMKSHSTTRRVLKPKKSCTAQESLHQNTLSKARQLERYLNYLVEHKALSSSFPLNAVLKASQGGLEAAKKLLQSTSNEKTIVNRTQKMEIGDTEKTYSFLSSVFYNSSSFNYRSESLSWVRTAAQAALALRLDGMLETTGMQSASAKLQHASLPQLMPTNHSVSTDSDSGNEAQGVKVSASEDIHAIESADIEEINSEFERGVINVKSELDSEMFDGFDMLPAPYPLAQRSALCAGSISSDMRSRSEEGTAPKQDSHGFVYDDDAKEVEEMLGDISMDRDIERLRDVIRSVDDNLGKCLASIARIGEAMRERNSLHLNIIKGLNSWGGQRGGFISERSLLIGVTELESTSEVTDHGMIKFSSDLSWNASLAYSAVSAAEELCESVNVSKTASKAKLAAVAAAEKAQNHLQTHTFATKEEADAAQTRASELQNHVIYSAVVEHEAAVAKRRVAKALGNDVKYWNVHRKRELYHACLATVKSHHTSTLRSIDAWSQLKDGLLNLFSVPMTVEKRVMQATKPIPSSELNRIDVVEEVLSPQEITVNREDIAKHHFSVSNEVDRPAMNEQSADSILSHIINSGDLEDLHETFMELDVMKSRCGDDDQVNDVIHMQESLPLPMPPADDLTEIVPSDTDTSMLGTEIVGIDNSEEMMKECGSQSNDATKSMDQLPYTDEKEPDLKHARLDQASEESRLPSNNLTETETCNQMTDSMQSLVDGLMTWGGQYDSEDDLSLPQGMAASLVLEERTRVLDLT